MFFASALEGSAHVATYRDERILKVGNESLMNPRIEFDSDSVGNCSEGWMDSELCSNDSSRRMMGRKAIRADELNNRAFLTNS